MHLSKLQGKRSLGLSALLAQRNTDSRPAGSLPCQIDEPSFESKFLRDEEQRNSVDQPYSQVIIGSFEMPEQLFTLSAMLPPQTDQEEILDEPLISSQMESSTGIAKWRLPGDPSTGTAMWALVNTKEVVRSQCQQEQHVHGLNTNSFINDQIFASKDDVNIFHQNSREINASFIEKQRRIIVDLNEATSSFKLQLQFMQQERDDVVFENSALHAVIEEQKHEQQTQLLSFSLKLLQDEAELRKYHHEIHGLTSEISM
jgi:hypothetical protein